MASNDNQATIKLIVGLGNPGDEYKNTRHNAGFMVIEKILSALVHAKFEETYTAESKVFTGRFRGKQLICQMPMTYMNSSGLAVGKIARREGILPEEILVISDDLDLPVGRMRIRKGGSDGGHNGLKSIIAELGSANFNRLRVGIGRPEPGGTIDYVLNGFEGEEAKEFSVVLDRSVEAVKMVLSSGIVRAMNTFNAAAKTEESKVAKKTVSDAEATQN